MRPSLLLVVALATYPWSLSSQVTSIRSVTPDSHAVSLADLKHRQQEFEGFRKQNAPLIGAGRGTKGQCDEQVGRFCYWYDETEPGPPEEPQEIARRRTALIAAVDSGLRATPADRWMSGVLVRYLAESGRHDEAIAAAGRCAVNGWWCPALRGYAFHTAGRFAEADSAFGRALAVMDPEQRCDWLDLKLILDDAMLRDYRESRCEARAPLEQRIWWLARPMMSAPGSDARSEFLARRLYTVLVEDAPTPHEVFTEAGVDTDTRELTIRYGWARAWSRSTGYAPGRGQISVVTGHEPAPAPPMLPTAATLRNPAFSDSVGWRGKGLPGVRARYSPSHARRLLALTHQAALFRRGDSALVALAWDATRDDSLRASVGDDLTAALVLTRGEESDATIVRAAKPGLRGTLTATTAWAPMLMSAEIASPRRRTLARARYGLRATDLPGNRVAISDLLLFDAYDGMPRSLDEALSHARSTQVLDRGTKLGVYWETYNTDPKGEGIQVDITVAPEQADGSWLRRGLSALRLVREAQPVSMGLTDASARGMGFTPRSVVVDLATLKPGRYLMQLEVTAKDTPTVRAERVIVVR